MHTHARDSGLWFRAAFVTLLGAIAIWFAGSSPAYAQAGALDASPAILRTVDTGWIQITNTATANQSTTRVGFRGTVSLCGHGQTTHRSITCVETATAIQSNPYAPALSQLQVLLNDGNNDDTLVWDDVDITIVCDDIYHEPRTYVYSNVDLTETTQALGASDNGPIAYCGRIRSVSYVNNDASPAATDYTVFDASDSIRLATTDVIVLPAAPIRLGPSSSTQRVIDVVSFRGDAGEDINVQFTKANQCTTALVRGGWGGIAIDLSTCFSGSGDVTDATAAMIEGSFARVVGFAANR